MLKELKFVQGAVGKKDFLPALTFYQIKDGIIRSYNGVITLSTPIAIDIDCIPKAVPFYKAISMCQTFTEDQVIAFSMTAANRLSIKSGKFKAFIDCVEEPAPITEPEGDMIEVDGELLLNALQKVFPFIGDDASRPWSTGVLFAENSIYATTNVMIIQYWLGVTLPIPSAVPREAIKEILRIGLAPTHLQFDSKTMTVHYGEDKWLKTTLIDLPWPDVEPILNVEAQTNYQLKDNDQFFAALDFLKPFLDGFGRVYFNNGVLSTSEVETLGAHYEVENFAFDGVYRYEHLKILQDVAHTIDFSQYPSRCPFYGDQCRGVLIGYRRLQEHLEDAK